MVVTEIFSVEYWRYLEIWVRGSLTPLRSLKMVLIDRFYIGLPCRCNYRTILHHFRGYLTFKIS